MGAVLLCLAFALLVSQERTASAYIDPGSGAMLWQLAVAAMAAAAYALRGVLRRLGRRSPDPQLAGGKDEAAKSDQAR